MSEESKLENISNEESEEASKTPPSATEQIEIVEKALSKDSEDKAQDEKPSDGKSENYTETELMALKAGWLPKEQLKDGYNNSHIFFEFIKKNYNHKLIIIE